MYVAENFLISKEHLTSKDSFPGELPQDLFLIPFSVLILKTREIGIIQSLHGIQVVILSVVGVVHENVSSLVSEQKYPSHATLKVLY